MIVNVKGGDRWLALAGVSPCVYHLSAVHSIEFKECRDGSGILNRLEDDGGITVHKFREILECESFTQACDWLLTQKEK